MKGELREANFKMGRGGKTQLLDTLLGHFPTEMNNYREIFLGGGSVLFASVKLNGRKTTADFM